MATVNYCADGRTYLELTQADIERADFARGDLRLDLELSDAEAEALRDDAAHAVEEREEATR